MLNNGQTYFKKLAVSTTHDLSSMFDRLSSMAHSQKSETKKPLSKMEINFIKVV